MLKWELCFPVEDTSRGIGGNNIGFDREKKDEISEIDPKDCMLSGNDICYMVFGTITNLNELPPLPRTPHPPPNHMNTLYYRPCQLMQAEQGQIPVLKFKTLKHKVNVGTRL